MPKTQLFSKEEASLKAMNLFWKKGYKGTSLDDLTYALEIGKGSFYNTFKSKRNLFEYCIGIYRNNSINSLKEILESEEDVKTGLLKFLKINFEYAINDPEHRGCFLTNNCTELANSDEQINKLMNDHYKTMRIIMSDYLSKGSDLKDEAVSKIVNTVITFFIGMTVQVKLNNSKDRIESSINHLLKSLF